MHGASPLLYVWLVDNIITAKLRLFLYISFHSVSEKAELQGMQQLYGVKDYTVSFYE